MIDWKRTRQNICIDRCAQTHCFVATDLKIDIVWLSWNELKQREKRTVPKHSRKRPDHRTAFNNNWWRYFAVAAAIAATLVLNDIVPSFENAAFTMKTHWQRLSKQFCVLNGWCVRIEDNKYIHIENKRLLLFNEYAVHFRSLICRWTVLNVSLFLFHLQFNVSQRMPN